MDGHDESQNTAESGAPANPPNLSSSEPKETELSPESQEIKDQVVETLKTIFDPEIPVNIYELGMIYDVDVLPESVIHVRMTLTSPMCPVAGTLPGEVQVKIGEIDGVKEATVDLVWDPPWNPDMMSEAARMMLNL